MAEPQVEVPGHTCETSARPISRNTSQHPAVMEGAPLGLTRILEGVDLLPLSSITADRSRSVEQMFTITVRESPMEAWGIIMTAMTLLSMLVLVVASVTTDDGSTTNVSMELPMEAESGASGLREAA
jgi:hypothetical protein